MTVFLLYFEMIYQSRENCKDLMKRNGMCQDYVYIKIILYYIMCQALYNIIKGRLQRLITWPREKL